MRLILNNIDNQVWALEYQLQEYFKLFEEEIPILPSVFLQNGAPRKTLSVLDENLLAKGKELPFFDNSLSSFVDGTFEFYELFELGHLAKGLQHFSKCESLGQIIARLHVDLTEDFSSWKNPDQAAELLKKINRDLKPLSSLFIKIYEETKESIWRLHLSDVAKRNNLVFAEDGESLVIKEGQLFFLAMSEKSRYVPLNIEVHSGVSLIFGHNMGGKTTALRTIHFLFFIASLGLPVPAKQFVAPLSMRADLHLKNSGKTLAHLSSFSDELTFISNNQEENSIILIDELMGSTHPIAGLSLSHSIIDYYKSKKSIFVATTQYPELLNLSSVSYFKVDESDKAFLLKKVSQLEPNEFTIMNKKPLELALTFPLQKELKELIRSSLKE